MLDKSKFTVKKENGKAVLSYDDKNAYYAHSDLDKKTLIAADKYRSEFVKSAVELSASEAKELMLKDKTIGVVNCEFPFSTSARGSINVQVDRQKTFPGIGEGKAPTTKSKITVQVKDPINKIGKTRCHELEDEMTKLFVK